MDIKCLEYDEKRHKSIYSDMMYQYAVWLDGEIHEHYGVHLFPVGKIRETSDRIIQGFDGVVLMLEVDDKIVGTARLNTLSDKIGGIHNVYIDPKYRGKGYSKLLMNHVEDKGRELGFTKIRLDTGGFNKIAQSLYKKLGYLEIEGYNPIREHLRNYDEDKVYMEKVIIN